MTKIRIIAGKDISVLVKDPQWQALRQSFVGTWKKTPGKNIGLLKKYLGDYGDHDRVVRVYNYLTGSAFRIGVIQHPDIDVLLRKVRKVAKV